MGSLNLQGRHLPLLKGRVRCELGTEGPPEGTASQCGLLPVGLKGNVLCGCP